MEAPAPRETPIRRQYQRLKAQHPDCVLLFQLGDFFETFEDDARLISRVCGLHLTSREFGKGDRVPLAGVPLGRLDHYLSRLIEAGYHVAVAEQVTQPGSGLVEREITRVVTPGTLAEPGLLHDREHTYLGAVTQGRSGGIGLAYVDVSTGDFALTQLDGKDAQTRLRLELERLRVAEVLVPEQQLQTLELPPETCRTPAQAWRFDPLSARERLCAHFGVLSLDGFGCAQMPLAVAAAGAIVAYLQETTPRLLNSLAGLRSYQVGSGMQLDATTRRNLELLRNNRAGRPEGSLLGVLDRTLTPMGGRLLRAWLSQPLLDVAAIEQRLAAVQAFVDDDSTRHALRQRLNRIGDLERVTARIAQGVASQRDLLHLADALHAAAELAFLLADWPPGACLPAPDPCSDVEQLIHQAIAPLGSGRTVRPGYSPELDGLVQSIADARRWLIELEQRERQRTGIKSLKVGFNKVSGYYLEVSRPNLAAVPADYQRKQTLTNAERFVTADLREVEARIVGAEERVAGMEADVFDELLRTISRQSARLRRLAGDLAHLDVYAGFAHVARERGYCRPTVDDSQALLIEDGRHPVVEASLPPGSYIPNDCRLAPDACQLLLLTGPNMAGKSTYLRQVALIVLMAQTGSFVPARRARVGLVDRVFTRVGAQDDLAGGASTFMVEMTEAATILRHATERSLLVLDEIGRGTSTFDGVSIARAVMEEIHHRIGARTLFATHFHELASLAESLPRLGVFNAAVAEDDGQLVFLRRVQPGAADRSYGIHVARLAGLPPSVTYRAQVILNELESSQPIARGVRDGGPAEPYGSDDATRVLDDILSLELSTLSPIDALNKLWEIQRSAARSRP